MKLDFKEISKETNQQAGEQIDIKISNTKIVSDLLKKHYAFPIRTLVQEYLTNAKDAHKQAKTEKQIEVTIPTKISPILKIRDFGPSLNPDQIKNIFAELGESTKRETDNQSGGFGIGSKSAFAYRDNFYLRTYIDKVERLYEITKANRYEGQINLIVEKPTSQENGVCIEVPVEISDIDSFFNAVLRATYFWKNKPKLLSVDPEKLPDTYKKLNILVSNDNWRIIDAFHEVEFNSFFNSSYIFVVDEIPYDIKENQFFTEKHESKKTIPDDIKEMVQLFLSTRHGSYADKVYLVIEKPVGSVDIAISREEFEYSPSNKQKLRKDLENALKDAREKIQQKVYEIADIGDKINFLNKLKKFTCINKENLNEFDLYPSLGIKYNTFSVDKIHAIGLTFMSFYIESDHDGSDNIRFKGYDEIETRHKSVFIMATPSIQSSRKEVRDVLQIAFDSKLIDKKLLKNKQIIIIVPRTRKIAKLYESLCFYDLNKVKDNLSFVKCFLMDRWRRQFSLVNENVVNIEHIPKQSVVLYNRVNGKFKFKLGADNISKTQLIELRDLFRMNKRHTDLVFISESEFFKKKISNTKLITYKNLTARKEFVPVLFTHEINSFKHLKYVLCRHTSDVAKTYNKLLPYNDLPTIKNKKILELLILNHGELINEYKNKIKKLVSFSNKIKKEDLTLYYIIHSNEYELGSVVFDKNLKKIFDKYLKYLK